MLHLINLRLLGLLNRTKLKIKGGISFSSTILNVLSWLKISSLVIGGGLLLQIPTLATEVISLKEGSPSPEISLPAPTITPNNPSALSWQDSPVLQRWQQQIPNILTDIENDPSFRTRWRLGQVANNQQREINIGVEDIFLGERLTLSGDYQSGNPATYGAELRYYLLPLGNYVNAAPVVGYRQINSEDLTASGLRIGGRLQVVLSRPSAADIAFSQTWVAPGSSQEIAITNLAVGYAITHNLRVGTQWQLESRGGKSDRRWGIFVELY